MRRNRQAGGFTLIELLVVIAIIGVLAALLLPTLTAVRCRSKESAAQSAIRDMETAIKAYESDYARFPPDILPVANTGNAFQPNWPLVWALCRPGGRGTSYYAFRRESQGTAGGLKWTPPLLFADQIAIAPFVPPTAANTPCFYSPLWAPGALSETFNQYFYQEWQSEPTPKPAGSFNPFSFDMWTGSCALINPAGGTDADRYGGASAVGKPSSTITNWK